MLNVQWILVARCCHNTDTVCIHCMPSPTAVLLYAQLVLRKSYNVSTLTATYCNVSDVFSLRTLIL